MKLVIITGTSQGLGKAFFDYYSNTDYGIFAISRRFTEEQISTQKNDPSKYILQTDDLAQISTGTLARLQEVLHNTVSEHLIFINNAGAINPIGNIGDLDETEVHRSIAVNLTAPILITNAILSGISKSFKTTIINISSGAANHPVQGWAMYCSVKAAVRMFFDVLKMQCGDTLNLLIKNIDPGVIDTAMQSTIRSSNEDGFPQLEKFQKYKDENKLQSPQEVAAKIIEQIHQNEDRSIS